MQMVINHEAIGGVMKEVVEVTGIGIDLEVMIGVVGMIGTVIEAAAIMAATGIDTEAEIETGIGTGTGIERDTVTVTDQGIDREIDLVTDQKTGIGAEKTTGVIADVIRAIKRKL